jgi:hypothetical protein
MISLYKARLINADGLRHLVLLHPQFSDLPFDEVQQMSFELLECKRGDRLEPTPDTLYVMLRGHAIEYSEPHLKRAYMGDYEPRDVIGWWPIDGYLEHSQITHYAQIRVIWHLLPELSKVKHTMQERHLWATRAQLALLTTTTAGERIRMDPPKPGESFRDIAHRLGISRERAYQLLKWPRGVRRT